jgi:hypothetical protein
LRCSCVRENAAESFAAYVTKSLLHSHETQLQRMMSDILNKTIVLVLNRNWQAINIRTPQEAFCQMATNVATALEIDGESHIRPVTWDEWITLPIRDGDNAVHTVRGAIRVPTVIVALNFAKVPKKRPKLCAKTIRERDGNRCQYTGKLLGLAVWSDHAKELRPGGLLQKLVLSRGYGAFFGRQN